MVVQSGGEDVWDYEESKKSILKSSSCSPDGFTATSLTKSYCVTALIHNSFSSQVK